MKYVIALFLLLTITTAAFADDNEFRYKTVCTPVVVDSIGPRALNCRGNGTDWEMQNFMGMSPVTSVWLSNGYGDFNVTGIFKLPKPNDQVPTLDESIIEFIRINRLAGGLKEPRLELRLVEQESIPADNIRIFKYQQYYDGLPLWKRGISVYINNDDDAIRINGYTIPTQTVEITTHVEKTEAERMVNEYFGDEYRGSCQTELVIKTDRRKEFNSRTGQYEVTYDPQLAWMVWFDSGEYETANYFVNAREGNLIHYDPQRFRLGKEILY